MKIKQKHKNMKTKTETRERKKVQSIIKSTKISIRPRAKLLKVKT